MNAYHFVGPTLRDGRAIPADGVWLEHDGAIVMCESGFHASIHPFDALAYAPGSTLCRVTLDGEIVTESDKSVARRRRIDARIDADDVLRLFARQCALSVIHLWNAPAVVRHYLETGNESIRDAARAAARDAAWAAARAAAWAAAWDAARDAARAAAWAAAMDAARAAQRARFASLVNNAFEAVAR